MDNTLAAEVVPLDLLGMEERSAKLKMRASLKGIKRPASLSARIGAAVAGMYCTISPVRRTGHGFISIQGNLIFPVTLLFYAESFLSHLPCTSVVLSPSLDSISSSLVSCHVLSYRRIGRTG